MVTLPRSDVPSVLSLARLIPLISSAGSFRSTSSSGNISLPLPAFLGKLPPYPMVNPGLIPLTSSSGKATPNAKLSITLPETFLTLKVRVSNQSSLAVKGLPIVTDSPFTFDVHYLQDFGLRGGAERMPIDNLFLLLLPGDEKV